MKNQVESILIVGGGSSGWMTGAALVKHLPNVKISLVESPDIKTIGVGESTLGHINEFFHFLGLRDEDWMKHCNATYKTSIKFTDFRDNPKDKPYVFHYPFGLWDLTDKPNGLMDWFDYKAKYPETPCENFAEFYHDAVLMTDHNKMTYNQNGAIRNFNPFNDVAYHMNAALFGEYLRDYVCKPNGLNHILATVKGASKDESGCISKIHTDKGDLTADLYIDCTGFKSFLLEEIMGIQFESFDDLLMNDRAIAAPIQYIDKNKEMECVTNCTAIENGWVWNTPLWDRIGTGYVYSSQFVSDDDALGQFKKHLKSNRMICQNDARIDTAEFRQLKIRHGKHEKAWEKNVVAVGLSNGFVEPLESTGLLMTHEAIIKLVNILKARNNYYNKLDVDSFNFSLNNQIDGFKNFIALHYALSKRDDTEYWRHVTNNISYKNTGIFEFFSHSMINSRRFASNVTEGLFYIAAGMGYNPTDSSRLDFHNMVYNDDPYIPEKVMDEWLKHKRLVMKIIDRLPTHYEFLKNNIYK
jgi:tryptophan halogenase